MKISLSWVLDHLDHDVKNLKSFAKDFQEKFNSSIGEMESFEYKVLSKDIFRDNFEGKDAWLIDDNGIRLATYKDIGGEKEGILPAPYTDEKIFKAGEFSDIIFDIDNKSLTHRADLWSHYGIAREISAFYGWKLKDINILDIMQSTDNSTGSVKAIVDSKVKAACKKFAVCEVDNIEITPSPFWLLIRLARVGSRSINLTVDLTNYVMLDLGNPMHAFDLKAFSSGIIEPKFLNGNKLRLLDENEITITSEDLVITDGTNPVALAGIMGGYDSGVTNSTKNILVEVAVFDPGVVRKATVRHKTRTEASSRFEKGLDLNGNLRSLKYYLTLLKNFQPGILINDIVSLGDNAPEQKIEINLSQFKKLLSVDIDNLEIINILEMFGFFTEKIDNNKLIVTVPSFRGMREFSYQADVLEEVGRYLGYNKVINSIPKIELKGWDLETHLKKRKIKDFCAYNGLMNEVSNYPLLDEEWYKSLKFNDELNIEIINPVSEFRYRPINSLIWHLTQNIYNNRASKSLKIFEVAPVWSLKDSNPKEVQKIAFAWLSSEDFYDFKNFFVSLFNMLGLSVYFKPEKKYLFKESATAAMYHNEKLVGHIGYAADFLEKKIEKPFLIAELNLDVLVEKIPENKIKPLAKFPVSKLDVSFFALNKLVKDLEDIIYRSHALINSVELIDSMQKKEWGEKKSYTFRYNIRSDDHTLNKDEIKSIQEFVENNLIKFGVELR